MPSAPTSGTEVSERTAANIREQRRAWEWSMRKISQKLRDHRCSSHPDGVRISAAVINKIENGVPAQGGYPAHIRQISVDELAAFAEIFQVTPESLME
jgi:hypothetical protein